MTDDAPPTTFVVTDIEADHGQRRGNLFHRSGRIEMIAEPVEGEFHL
jgi:hypothetical protein